MSLEKQNQDKQALLEITLKALRDEAFKAKLQENPTEAIKELYPEFNADNKVVVQDQTATDTIYINISSTQASLLYEGVEELELCEEDLEMVSGGAINEGCSIFNNCWFGCNKGDKEAESIQQA